MMVKVKDGSVKIDGNSKVIVTDVVGKNGVIHAIDAVLVPAAKTASAKKSGGCN
jgi:uncharacterized surface protein with fasciclin (FAS1) repeats